MKNIGINLAEGLQQALENNEFEVYYQPVIDLREGKISGTEALLRWNHPTLGILNPGDFLPEAEKTGLIIDIGAWVLEQSALQTLKWHNQGFTTLSLKIAINLSAQQLKRGNAVETLDAMIKKTGIKAEFLELELTEASLLDESLKPIIDEISKRGIHLSLDDFGTGFAALNSLKSYHINTLKIDKSLIQSITTRTKSANTVSAILAMAKELSINTLAEGVETKEQLEFLQERDCMFVQGYYFCKPLNAEKFTRLLEKHLKFFETP